jgi:hypothetical protein
MPPLCDNDPTERLQGPDCLFAPRHRVCNRGGNRERQKILIRNLPVKVIPGGSANICPGEIIMPNDDKRTFERLLDDYAALDESADTVVRQLRKISNSDGRRKIIKELRNLENRRLELLDQMDNLAKSI